MCWTTVETSDYKLQPMEAVVPDVGSLHANLHAHLLSKSVVLHVGIDLIPPNLCHGIASNMTPV